MIDTTRLRELAIAATPGPWKLRYDSKHCDERGWLYWAIGPEHQFENGVSPKDQQYYKDAELIVEMRNSLLGLLDEIDEWRGSIVGNTIANQARTITDQDAEIEDLGQQIIDLKGDLQCYRDGTTPEAVAAQTCHANGACACEQLRAQDVEIERLRQLYHDAIRAERREQSRQATEIERLREELADPQVLLSSALDSVETLIDENNALHQSLDNELSITHDQALEIDRLREALRKIVDKSDCVGHGACRRVLTEPEWCRSCIARAALEGES